MSRAIILNGLSFFAIYIVPSPAKVHRAAPNDAIVPISFSPYPYNKTIKDKSTGTESKKPSFMLW